MSHLDQSMNSFAAEVSSISASAPTQATSRRARRSNSIRKLILRQDSISLISSDEEMPVQRIRTGSEERKMARSGSFKILVSRKNNNDGGLQALQAHQSRTASRREDMVPKSRRSFNGGRVIGQVTPTTQPPAPSTPIANHRRSLRAKSFNFVAPKLSLPLTSKREAELELSRQQSASRIRELDQLLASKSPSQPIKTKVNMVATKSLSASSTGIVHSWDGALAHVTPGRNQRRRVVGRSKSVVYAGTNKPASTLDILTAYDEIMKDFDDDSILDTNTGW
jgi:hypothetical protein